MRLERKAWEAALNQLRRFPDTGTLPGGGSLKPSASTDTKEPGTPTPETGTTAAFSSYSVQRAPSISRFDPISPRRANSFTVPGWSTAATVTHGSSGAPGGRVV